MTMKHLQLHKAFCGYGKRVILPDVTLHVQEGDICLIEGGNGIGKTTLGLSLLGLLRLIQGERETTFNSPSYVPQRNSLDPQYPLTLQTIISMGQADYAKFDLFQLFRNRKKNTKKLIEELERLGLYEKRKLRFNEASGGELQRALVARALIASPDLVLFDEPFANIDQKGRMELKDILLRENQERKTTLIVIDHHSNIDFYNKRITIKDNRVETHESH